MGSIPNKISRVRISTLSGFENEDTDYADSAEERLLEIFSRHETSEEKVEAVLASNPDWAMYYHLTPLRANLFRGYDFPKGSRVLEIGAGCGAITQELVRNPVSVTSIELSSRRALINAHRNHAASNLEIVVGNIEKYKPKEKFDFVVCVGVLEYAGTFIHSNNPYRTFLDYLYSFLKKDGVLLLAIENRLGLKYWSGAKEDHTQQYFSGLNGYPEEKKVQTFGKKELTTILAASKFKDSYFYFPFPDYKTPFFVYSEDYYPGHNATFPLGRLPTPTLDRPREHFFSEQNAMIHLENNDLFPEFSNSFLVEAKK